VDEAAATQIAAHASFGPPVAGPPPRLVALKVTYDLTQCRGRGNDRPQLYAHPVAYEFFHATTANYVTDTRPVGASLGRIDATAASAPARGNR
jgi:hypothetical protein